MVIITSLQRLSRFISNENLQTMKKRSTRLRNVSDLKGLIRQIKKSLNIASGNDTLEMIRGTLRIKFVLSNILILF